MNLIRKGFDKLLSFGCIISETTGIKCMHFSLQQYTVAKFTHFFFSTDFLYAYLCLGAHKWYCFCYFIYFFACGKDWLSL